MQRILDTEFSLLSMVDSFGRVFFQNDKVYRAIQNTEKEYCINLLNSDLFKELTEKGLVPHTQVSDLKIEGFDLVLEHEKLLETYQHEWTFSMIKNVALAILEVNEICLKNGYELKDAHMFNVLFRGTQPVWVDIGSITPKNPNTSSWVAYNGFLNAIVVPLIFWSKNKTFIARKLLESIFYGLTTIPEQSFSESGLFDLLELTKPSYSFKIRSIKLFNTKRKIKLLSLVVRVCKGLIKKIFSRNTVLFSYSTDFKNDVSLEEVFPYKYIKSTIKLLPVHNAGSIWKGYHQNYYNKEEGTSTFSYRFNKILELIKSTNNIQSIIDIAGNEGYFSQLLEKELPTTRIIITDYDQNAIDSAYNYFKKSNSENVTTLLLNLMYTPNMEGTAKRLQSDLVLVLALTHHLVLTGNYALSAIFQKIRLLSKKYVMIEFMPLGLWSTETNEFPTLPGWYNINWFKNTFEQYFDTLLQEKLEENRILFFGKIK